MAPALQATTAMLARRTTTASMGGSALRAVAFMAQQRGYATPKGPPPANFRQSKRMEWAWEKDSTLDRMGKFFLMTEMARGMYVLLEQYFRPPYVQHIFSWLNLFKTDHGRSYTIYYPFEKVITKLVGSEKPGNVPD